MKNFIYILILLLLTLLFHNVLKYFNIVEGLECAPKQNSLSYSNQAAIKAQFNELDILKNEISMLGPVIQMNSGLIATNTKNIKKSVGSIKTKAAEKEAELNKAAGQLKE